MKTYGKAERFIEIFNELETYMGKFLLKRPELIPSSYQGNYMSYRKKNELLSQRKIIQSGFLQEVINYGSGKQWE